jgi:hypothetical protein
VLLRGSGPSEASLRATASPNPCVDPVITARLPSSSFKSSSHHQIDGPTIAMMVVTSSVFKRSWAPTNTFY